MTNNETGPPETDLRTKLRNSAACQSLFVEYEVGRILESSEWTISQSPYYVDPQEFKFREIDVLAEQRWGVPSENGQQNFVNLHLLIECKSNSSYHLLFGGETGLRRAFSDQLYRAWLGEGDGPTRVAEALTAGGLTEEEVACQLKRFKGIAAPDGRYRHPAFDIKPPTASFRASSFRETNIQKDRTEEGSAVLWKALMSVKSFMDRRMISTFTWTLDSVTWAVRREKEDFEEETISENLDGDFVDALKEAYVFHPVIVIDSQLWKADASDIEGIDWGRLKLSVLGGKDWWCDIVHKPDFASYASGLSDHYRDCFAQQHATRMGV